MDLMVVFHLLHFVDPTAQFMLASPLMVAHCSHSKFNTSICWKQEKH